MRQLPKFQTKSEVEHRGKSRIGGCYRVTLKRSSLRKIYKKTNIKKRRKSECVEFVEAAKKREDFELREEIKQLFVKKKGGSSF
jgi:hypothetical protein